jgi:predicted aspartyl protease
MRTLLLLPLAAAASAQEAPRPEQATPDLVALGTNADRMTVPVHVAEAGPFPFVIDTGAQRTVISRELAGILRLSAGPVVRLTDIAGTSTVATVLVPALRVSKVSGGRVAAPALDAADLGASGILGIDQLQGHAVTIDFDRREMNVRASRRRLSQERRRVPGEVVIEARNLLGQLVVTDAAYRRKEVRVVLDTGAAVTMGNEALRRLIERKAPTQRVMLTSVTGETLHAGYTQIGKVRVGDVSFDNLPVAFTAPAPFRQFGLDDRPALLLGMDALRMFRRVEIDFANREVRLLLPRA